jgi:hypothetical protein
MRSEVETSQVVNGRNLQGTRDVRNQVQFTIHYLWCCIDKGIVNVAAHGYRMVVTTCMCTQH